MAVDLDTILDVDTIASNHASILAHLFSLTLTNKYNCHCELDSINLKGKLIRICDMLLIYLFTNIVI